jgi:hypothetical protein
MHPHLWTNNTSETKINMDKDIIHMLVSSDELGLIHLHGIFTEDYLNEHKYYIKTCRENLKRKYPSVKMYLLPVNHYVEKGMII